MMKLTCTGFFLLVACSFFADGISPALRSLRQGESNALESTSNADIQLVGDCAALSPSDIYDVELGDCPITHSGDSCIKNCVIKTGNPTTMTFQCKNGGWGWSTPCPWVTCPSTIDSNDATGECPGVKIEGTCTVPCKYGTGSVKFTCNARIGIDPQGTWSLSSGTCPAPPATTPASTSQYPCTGTIDGYHAMGSCPNTNLGATCTIPCKWASGSLTFTCEKNLKSPKPTNIPIWTLQSGSCPAGVQCPSTIETAGAKGTCPATGDSQICKINCKYGDSYSVFKCTEGIGLTGYWIDTLEGGYCPLVCPPGQYSPRGVITSCTPCPINTYQTKTIASECIDCPAMHITYGVGSTTCVQGPTGK